MPIFQDGNIRVEVRLQEAGPIVRVSTQDGGAQIRIPRELAPQVAAALWPNGVEALREALGLIQRHLLDVEGKGSPGVIMVVDMLEQALEPLEPADFWAVARITALEAWQLDARQVLRELYADCLSSLCLPPERVARIKALLGKAPQP